MTFCEITLAGFLKKKKKSNKSRRVNAVLSGKSSSSSQHRCTSPGASPQTGTLTVRTLDWKNTPGWCYPKKVSWCEKVPQATVFLVLPMFRMSHNCLKHQVPYSDVLHRLAVSRSTGSRYTVALPHCSGLHSNRMVNRLATWHFPDWITS